MVVSLQFFLSSLVVTTDSSSLMVPSTFPFVHTTGSVTHFFRIVHLLLLVETTYDDSLPSPESLPVIYLIALPVTIETTLLKTTSSPSPVSEYPNYLYSSLLDLFLSSCFSKRRFPSFVNFLMNSPFNPVSL